MELDHLFYLLDTVSSEMNPPSKLNLDYSVSIWRPRNLAFRLPEVSTKDIIVWQLFHYARIFKNNEFAVFMINKNHNVVHRSFIFPKFFRYPFMERIDLQIGNIWTHPDHRGRGLAEYAIKGIVRSFGKPKRRFWYIVEKHNTPSIRVIEKCNFRKVGEGIRSNWLNLKLFGSFIIKHYEEVNCYPS